MVRSVAAKGQLASVSDEDVVVADSFSQATVPNTDAGGSGESASVAMSSRPSVASRISDRFAEEGEDLIRYGRRSSGASKQPRSEDRFQVEPSSSDKRQKLVADLGGVEATDRSFSRTRSRRALCFTNLLRSLTDAQREDVKSIGFGGLLEFTCEALPDEMNSWLQECFNPRSKYFHCNGEIRFSVTAVDAKRAFGLPISTEREVVCDNFNTCVRCLLKRWESQHGIEAWRKLTVGKVLMMLQRLKSGGLDFKRFFILYAMKMLLAPDYGNEIKTGLVKSLLDVDAIKSLNWAGYVVQYLCEALYNYNTKVHEPQRGCEGCFLLLQLTYFHRTIWPDAPLSMEEPFIKHWTGTSILMRALEEQRAGGYGKLLFKKMGTGFYSKRKVSELGWGADAEDGDKSGRQLHSLDDKEIGLAIPQVHRRRNWEVLSAVDSVVSRFADSLDLYTQNLRSCAFRQLEGEDLLFDGRHAYDVVARNLYEVCAQLSPDMANIGPNLRAEANPVVEPVPRDYQIVELNKRPWLNWVYMYPAIYRTDFLKKVAKLCHGFAQYQLEVADYLCSGGEARAILFHDGNKFRLSRADFWTFQQYMPINPDCVTAFSMVMNQYWAEKRLFSTICFGAIDSDDGPVEVPELAKNWAAWLDVNELQLGNAHLVHIPCSWDGDWFLVSINFLDGRVQCIQTRAQDEGEVKCLKLGHAIGTMFWNLLELKKETELLDKFRNFNYEYVTPSWCGLQNFSDQGIVLMNMMEKYTGSPNCLDLLMLDEDKKKLQLRVAYLCTIALSFKNKKRGTVLDGTKSYLEAKAMAESG